MSRPGVHTLFDEPVRIALRGLNGVIEALACLCHCCGSDGLADEDHEEACEHELGLDGGRETGQPGRENQVANEAFNEGGEVGDVVGGPIGGEKER